MFYGIMEKTWAGGVNVVPENTKHREIRGENTLYLIGREHIVEGTNKSVFLSIFF